MRTVVFCAALLVSLPMHGQKHQEGATNTRDRGTVTVYRDSGRGTLKSPPIYLDGVQIAELGNKRYFSIQVLPGKRMFWSNPKDAVEIQVQAGRTYFIRAEYPTSNGVGAYNWKPKLRLFEVTAEQGKKDVEPLKPLDRNRLFNSGIN
jgi:Protein of unknown function (DUF2846)